MTDLVRKPAVESIPNYVTVNVGEWYYVKCKREEDFFGCVVQIGTNFIELRDPYDSTIRVHLDEFEKRCVRELDPEKVIHGHVEEYRKTVQEKLGQIREITARLGLDPKPVEPASESMALSVLSGTDNVKKYQKDLILAKEKTLPKLFEEVKEAHEGMATWLKAQTLPMKAAAGGMKECVEKIEDRVFNVSLYAGLSEEVVRISKGQPAPSHEKVHLFQRLLYMDEEALLNYKHGGMEFKDIKKFDTWLAKPENRDRALPFPRSVVAFRVRRERKERDWEGDISKLIQFFHLEQADKSTFLYLRNGDNLWRLDTDMDFDELIFPGRNEFNVNEPMMAKMFCDRVDELVPVREYEDRVKKAREEARLYKEWERQNPDKSWVHNPHDRHLLPSLEEWEPFDPTSVYFDEITKTITDRVKYYNRISLILQGLFDRSEVFHPHAPVQLWKPDGFESAMKLVYDGENLHYGDPPDFEKYRAEKNASLKEGSITIGQQKCWLRKEAQKESSRMDRSWRTKSDYRPEEFQPYGNPGPGYLAPVGKWTSRTRKALFTWVRKRMTYNPWSDRSNEPCNARIVVPDTGLFNVDAYVPGEYKRFFQDPRTRAQYIVWAPLLLTAEEYHAGNAKVGPKEEE